MDSSERESPPCPVVSNRRTLSIQAQGDTVCFPDVFRFNISIFSSKALFEDAQSSVKKRSDYALQALKNHGLSRGKHVEVISDVERWEESSSVHCNIAVSCHDQQNCCSVRNLLIQKLNSSVQFSPIYCSVSLQHKANKREEAFKQAVTNAQAKAQSVCGTLGVQLGPAVSLVEKNLTETPIGDVCAAAKDRKGVCKLADSVAKATSSFSSEVSVVFEATAPKTCSQKRCTRRANN